MTGSEHERGSTSLDGDHAIITGGGRGIGLAIADALAGAGARVTLMGRDTAALEEAAAGLSRHHRVTAHAVRADVSDEDSVRAAFTLAAEQAGAASILVNNAGIAEGTPFLDTRRERWDHIMAVNATGAFLCAQQVLPAMVSARRGRIINVASTSGLRGAPRIAAYCASKHALIGLTRSLAAEFAKQGITVNAVCPGYTDTSMADRAVDTIVAGTGKPAEEALRMITRVSAFGRLLRPEEVAATVLWLCSPRASAITGQALVIGGEIL